MKKLTLVLIIFCFALSIKAQSERSISEEEWLLSVGLNTINSLGTKGPFNNPGDWAFRTPLAITVETKWFDLLSIEAGLTVNGFEKNKRLDAAGPPSDNLTYFALDIHGKYYFGESLLPRTEWIDFYGLAGLSFFVLDDSNISVNIGGGAIFWLNRNKSFGIKPQGIAKFAIGHSNSGQVYQNNHFQYSLQAIFRL